MKTRTYIYIYIYINRAQPNRVSRQRKATGPRLEGKHACTMAPHDCHPQSRCHQFSEKGSHICTLNTTIDAISFQCGSICIYV